MKIYIIAHKKFTPVIEDDIHRPLQVGAALHELISEAWQQDNQGDNISDKNLSYNELTGLYWIWKNSDEDIIGLCHYRRYFVTPLGKLLNLLFNKKTMFLSEKRIEKYLLHHDLIVHNKTIFLNGNKAQFHKTQKYPNDVDLLGEIISSNYSEYLPSYYNVMKKKSCHLLNMVIMKKELLDSYCTWLFSILSDVENSLISNGETDFDRRLGMLGERMLDIWLDKNKLKIKECFSINTERKDWKLIS